MNLLHDDLHYKNYCNSGECMKNEEQSWGVVAKSDAERVEEDYKNGSIRSKAERGFVSSLVAEGESRVLGSSTIASPL